MLTTAQCDELHDRGLLQLPAAIRSTTPSGCSTGCGSTRSSASAR
jgi:hypothetical protein